MFMGEEAGYKWYVVRCFSGHEKKVRTYLEEEIATQGLDDRIADVLIPTETVIEVRNGKKRQKEKNFFPGYILLEAVYDDAVNDLVQNAPSTLGFLKTGNSKLPTPLQPSEVKRILSRVDRNRDDAADGAVIDIPYKEGDLVRVTDGPFKDFDGTVQEVDSQKLKLRVLVSIFGRKTPVEVDLNQVEVAS